MGRSLFALIAVVCVAAGAASFAPTTAVGRVQLDPPVKSGGWAQVRPQRPTPRGHVIVRVRPGHALALRSRPVGPVLARVGSTTQFGSPQSFSVVGTQRGRWLAVTEAGVGNNRVVW
ncbi:MAG TPA: hypothetical protein VF833_08890, partial [Gaiellaceae bacterium]